MIDEAHRAKNPLAFRAKSVAALAAQTRHVVLLTGTPLRNSPEEAETLLTLLDQERVVQVDAWATQANRKIRPAQRAAVLRAQLLPVMIRRKKSDVLPELPPQVHEWRQLVWADNDETRRLLDAVDDDLAKCAAARDDVTRGGAFMRAVHHLGQAKALAPSLCEHVVARARAGRPTLVFAKHLSVVKSLREQFAAAGVRVVVVTGKVPAKERRQAYEDFRARRTEVFLGTIDAAGESESLTAADEVVFAELHWVPAALEQAAGRGHRLGQRSETYSIVYYHAAHPIDEGMMNTIRRKLGYIGDVLADSEAISLRDLITTVLRRHGGPHSGD